MTDHHLINIILNGITPHFSQAMAHCEDLCSDLFKWKEKLLHMDFITTKFQKKEQDDKRKGQGKNSSLEERVQWRGVEAGNEKKKAEWVPKEVWDKCKLEGRCMKHGRSNHLARDCKTLLRAKTSPFSNNANQEPVQKKRKLYKKHSKIMEISLEENSGNE